MIEIFQRRNKLKNPFVVFFNVNIGKRCNVAIVQLKIYTFALLLLSEVYIPET